MMPAWAAEPRPLTAAQFMQCTAIKIVVLHPMIQDPPTTGKFGGMSQNALPARSWNQDIQPPPTLTVTDASLIAVQMATFTSLFSHLTQLVQRS